MREYSIALMQPMALATTPRPVLPAPSRAACFWRRVSLRVTIAVFSGKTYAKLSHRAAILAVLLSF